MSKFHINFAEYEPGDYLAEHDGWDNVPGRQGLFKVTEVDGENVVAESDSSVDGIMFTGLGMLSRPIEIVARIFVPTSSYLPEPALVAADTSGSMYYSTVWAASWGHENYSRYWDGSTLTSIGYSYDEAEIHQQDSWFRLRAESSTFYYKRWLSSEDEPVSWTHQVAHDEIDSFYPGIYLDSSSDGHMYEIGVGTEGDSAPTEPVASSNPPLAPTSLAALEL